MNDQQAKIEYDRMNGIGAKDYGSKAVIKRDVIALSKKLGYKTAGFHRMGRQQLFTIARELGGRCKE